MYRNAANRCIYDYTNVYQCRKCYKTLNIAPWTYLSVIIGYTLSKSPIIEDNQAPEGRRKKIGAHIRKYRGVGMMGGGGGPNSDPRKGL